MDQLISSDDVLAQELEDPEFREQWERTALARWIAVEVSHYRAVHSLSQRELADQLGMKQPQIARIESSEHNPSLDTLARLATGLDLELLIDIRPQGRDAKLPRKRRGRTSSFETRGAEVLVATA
jgi:transcriptional regulator with XRE-family HTH domain